MATAETEGRPSGFVRGRFDRSELETSVMFQKRRTLTGPAGERLLDRAMEALQAWEPPRQRARREADLVSTRTAMAAILANLIAARRNQVTPLAFVAMSFDAADYSRGAYTGPTLTRLRRFLDAAGMITGAHGYQRRIPGADFANVAHAMHTRLRATDRFLGWVADAGIDFAAAWGSPECGLGWLPGRELVTITRDLDANPGLEPDDVRASRPVVQAANDLVASAAIDMPADAWARVHAQLGDDAEDRNNRMASGDRGRAWLRRQFKRTWQEGGRLYGGWWQTMMRTERPFITINGRPTVELDFGRLHPTLLYALAGRDLDFDPYQVPGYPGPALREVGKLLFNKLVNHPDLSRGWPTPGAKELEALGSPAAVVAFTEALVAMHAPIGHRFGSGAGVRLQRLDSDILIEVLTRTTAAGIVALPIHDSLIVDRDHEDTLRTAMEEAYTQVTGFPAPAISRKG